jgi:hypothetical protein
MAMVMVILRHPNVPILDGTAMTQTRQSILESRKEFLEIHHVPMGWTMTAMAVSMQKTVRAASALTSIATATEIPPVKIARMPSRIVMMGTQA